MTFHMNTFAPPGVWLRLAGRNGGISPRYWARFSKILALSAAVSPLRVAEKALYSRVVARTPAPENPIFVCGFARSGTTHLHNLLSEDPNHGAISTLQAMVPTFFLLSSGRLRKLIQGRLTEDKRPVDNVKVSLDMPQECELAIANSTHMSLLYELSFNGMSRPLLRRYGLMGDGSDLSERELKNWKRIYVDILKKASIHAGGRRLVLKSPTYLGRLPLLADMFPEARFVHIVRNPYRVYLSMLHLYRVLCSINHVDAYDEAAIEQFLIDSYAVLMRAWLEFRQRIPEERLTEVRFEDLEKDPVGELARIYKDLSLPDWETARRPVEAYVASLRDYEKNVFTMSKTAAERVESEWSFAIEEWRYGQPAVDA